MKTLFNTLSLIMFIGFCYIAWMFFHEITLHHSQLSFFHIIGDFILCLCFAAINICSITLIPRFDEICRERLDTAIKNNDISVSFMFYGIFPFADTMKLWSGRAIVYALSVINPTFVSKRKPYKTIITVFAEDPDFTRRIRWWHKWSSALLLCSMLAVTILGAISFLIMAGKYVTQHWFQQVRKNSP